MIRLYLIIFLVFNSFLIFGQIDVQMYYKFCLKAEKKYNISEYDSSAYYYTKAFTMNCYKNSKDLYLASIVFTKIKQDSIGIEYLKEAYKKGLKSKKKLKSNKFWKDIKDSIPGYTHFAKSKNNCKYEYVIDSLFKEDQRVRTAKYSKAKKTVIKYIKDTTLNRNDIKYIKARKLMTNWQKTDSLNFFKLNKYIDMYGYPYEGNISNDDIISKAYIIIFHFDYDRTAKTTFNIIDTALVKGYITPVNYASIVDRRMMLSLGKMPYYYEIPIGLNRLSTKELDSLSKRRNNIGLPNIFEHLSIKYKGNNMKVTYKK